MMIEKREVESKEVVCLHCGQHTPLTSSASPEGADARRQYTPRLSLIRCSECGSESLYLAHEIVIRKKFMAAASGAAAF
jgi:hypothetical protein